MMRHSIAPAVRSFALAALTLLAAAVPAALAAAPASPIVFARGETGAELHGGIARGETARYTFAARAEQWAEIALRSVEDNAVLQLYGPGWKLAEEGGDEVVRGEGVMSFGEDAGATSWSGVLPWTGSYLLEVGSTRGGAEYDLSLALRAPMPEDCQELSQQPMNACFAAIAHEAEAARSRAYAALEKVLDADGRRRLAATETAWRGYRDAQCAYEADRYEGGSLAPTIFASCRATLTAQRTEVLAALREQEEDP